MLREIVSVITAGGGDATGFQWVEAGEAGKHSAMPRTVPTTDDDSVHDVSRAEAEESGGIASLEVGLGESGEGEMSSPKSQEGVNAGVTGVLPFAAGGGKAPRLPHTQSLGETGPP